MYGKEFGKLGFLVSKKQLLKLWEAADSKWCHLMRTGSVDSDRTIRFRAYCLK